MPPTSAPSVPDSCAGYRNPGVLWSDLVVSFRLTNRLGGRFTQRVKQPISWTEPVCSSSGYSSMSLVSALFWHAAGTGTSPA